MDFQKLKDKIQEARGKYYKLVLIVSPFTEAKTNFLLEASKALNYPYINFNMAVSGKLKDFPVNRRGYHIVDLLPSLPKEHAGEVLLFDHIELLFLLELEVDPLKALQHMTRNKIIVAGWSGECDGRQLTYASQGHPEHKKYQGLIKEEFTFLNI